MHLTLSPTRGLPGQAETALAVSGDTLVVDGTAYDLSAVPEGGQAVPQGADHPFADPITRHGGILHCAVRVVLDDTAAPDQPVDAAHWTIAEAAGTVPLPALRKEDGT